MLGWPKRLLAPPSDNSAISKYAAFAAKTLTAIRKRLNTVEIQDAASAHFVCRVIPSQCPFALDIMILERRIVHIPPLCELNPFYSEVSNLRFRALCYLAERGEDIRAYG